jgi:hypothetical protein
MKYVIIFFSAFIIEIVSTFYIRYASDGNMFGMLLFAFLGPFLSLPFAGYMVDSKLWIERFKMALSVSFGYILGVLIVIYLIK